MKTTLSIRIELQPFQTPNFAIRKSPPGKREDGFKPSESYPLSEVSKEALEAMCRDFRREVMRKAGYEA